MYLCTFQKCEHCTSDKWTDMAPMSTHTTRLLLVSVPHMLIAWSRVIYKGYNYSVSHKIQLLLQNPTVYYKFIMT
jgi:hypothetical protein